MRIFVCAGEPSGDVHGSNLITHLRRLDPDLECIGYGGPKMEAAGCRLLYPLTELAVMWFARVLANLHVFLFLLSKADRTFAALRPDAVILIDYPGFNWWLARRAHFRGIPVFWFVPPQIWAWGSWRVEKMRKWVDHVLCSLPFEEPWYRERGVGAEYIGHPYFDELLAQQPDEGFIAAKADAARGGPIITFLPGSRTQEVRRNFGTMLRAARAILAARPDARFHVACFRELHREYVNGRIERLRTAGASLPIEAHVGRTPELIRLATACVAVSGSVGLELLFHGKPSIVLYRLGRVDLRIGRFFMTTRFISLVNLLAGEELFPEFLTDRCVSRDIAGIVLGWLSDPVAYAAVCEKLATLRTRVARPGACDRAARVITDEARRVSLVRTGNGPRTLVRGPSAAPDGTARPEPGPTGMVASRRDRAAG